MGNVVSHSHRDIMTVKFVALVVLIFAVNSNANEESSLDRRKCKNSEPFYIKNEKKRKSYLTVDLETNAVDGAKKNGEANQQWRWSRCKKGATHLVNVATGGCLTLEGSVLTSATPSGSTGMMVSSPVPGPCSAKMTMLLDLLVS